MDIVEQLNNMSTQVLYFQQCKGSYNKGPKENARNKVSDEYFGKLISELKTAKEGVCKLEDKSVESIVKYKIREKGIEH